MKIRWIAFLLSIVMCLGMLAGCNTKKEEDKPTDKKPTAQEDTVPANLLALAEGGKSEYKIIYPKAKEWVKPYAQALSEMVLEKCGVEIPVKHDSEKGESAIEIRVGEVKGMRTEVLKLYSSFGKLADTDFVIHVEGKTVYVYGVASQGVASAVDYFVQKVLAFGKTSPWMGIGKNHHSAYVKSSAPTVTVTGSDDYALYFSLGAGTLIETFCKLSYTTSGGWRLQTKNRASEEFDDFGAAQRLAYTLGELDPSRAVKVTTTSEGNVTTVRSTTDGTYVQLNTEKFQIDYYTASGACASTVVDVYANAGGSYIVGTFRNSDEAVFGTGERFNTANQRGNTIEMVSKDIWSSATACYAAIPLMCLSRGSGIFINRYEAMQVDLGSAVKTQWKATVKEAAMDCYIFTTEEISDVIKGYSDLTGYAEQPEEWSYGMLLCRFSPDLSGKWSTEIKWKEESYGKNPDGTMTADERGMGVYDVIAKMEEYDLPWTGILAEPYNRYGGGATANDLKELCDYVHSLGKKFLVYIGVGGGMGDKDAATSYMVSQTLPDGTLNYKLPDTQDVYGNNPDNEGTQRYYLDVTNPAACDWFFGEIWDSLVNDIGVDGCKIDFCELMPETYELNYFDEKITTAGSHQWYSSAFCAKFWEMISQKPDSGMCYIRGGGIGLQRSPYVWAGDQKREFKSLNYQLSCVLSAGLTGIPFISYDMSGYEYKGGRAWKTSAASGAFWNDPGRSLAYESQVFIRGLQFSAFTICMQTHGTVRWAFEFAEEGDRIYEIVDGVTVPKKDASGNYVYDYVYVRDAATGAIKKDANGNKIIVKDQSGRPVLATPGTYAYVTDIYRAYVKLHELLTPYISEYSAIACETGMPLMRHMVLTWQDDENVYGIDDQYMFGDAFMVAPVLDSKYSRDIYLPEGVWRDLNTGERYEVGENGLWLEDYAVSITTLPVFYNEATTSTTAEGLLDGIGEIFDYLDEIEADIPPYLLGALQ